MEYAVLKSIAGFMNTHGGTLLVGVADDGAIVGIEEDFAFLGKKNVDGWSCGSPTCSRRRSVRRRPPTSR
jgi:predicted HTH transcriptional regulator